MAVMRSRVRVTVAFFVDRSSIKYRLWHDGFVAAVRSLEHRIHVRWINLADEPDWAEEEGKCDFLLVKSNWNWIVDRAVRQQFATNNVRKGLMISGVSPPPERRDMLFYDVLFYETEWYRPQLAAHPHVVHAFGVDTTIMRPMPGTLKMYDWLSVGQCVEPKRQWKLMDKPGRRLVIGDAAGSDQQIVTRLQDSGIEVRGFVPYRELAALYNRSRNVYIPATTLGGGERSVLEARACGVPVFVESDNPKLSELLTTPVWDHVYYANQLERGILAAVGI